MEVEYIDISLDEIESITNSLIDRKNFNRINKRMEQERAEKFRLASRLYVDPLKPEEIDALAKNTSAKFQPADEELWVIEFNGQQIKGNAGKCYYTSESSAKRGFTNLLHYDVGLFHEYMALFGGITFQEAISAHAALNSKDYSYTAYDKKLNKEIKRVIKTWTDSGMLNFRRLI